MLFYLLISSIVSEVQQQQKSLNPKSIVVEVLNNYWLFFIVVQDLEIKLFTTIFLTLFLCNKVCTAIFFPPFSVVKFIEQMGGSFIYVILMFNLCTNLWHNLIKYCYFSQN